MIPLIKTFEYGVKPNNYDWLKLIALLTMVIDHLGFYFFPDILWFRVIGRIAAPIFLFLVGYSENFRFNIYVLIGAIIVNISNVLSGIAVFPINILYSIIICRFIMLKLENKLRRQSEIFVLWLVLIIFFIAFALIIDYGTIALMFMILGFFAKQNFKGKSISGVASITIIFWIIVQSIVFKFTVPQIIVFSFVCALEAYCLYKIFWGEGFAFTKHLKLANYLNKPIILIARNSLLFYVLHLVLFNIMGHIIFPERFHAKEIVWIKISPTK